MEKNYYEVLGITKTATLEEIKKAYRTMALKTHPDKGGDASKFTEVQEAYDVLSNPNKRKEYDNPTPNFNQFRGFPQDAQMHGFDIDSIFNQMFGQQFGQHMGFGNHQNHRQTFRTRVSITLVDAYNCSEQIFNLHTNSGNKVIKIKIPYGVKTGDQIRYDDVIDNAILIVEFVILPDLRFERKYDDLYSNISVSVLDLIVGTTIEFKTINEKTVQINIPEKTQPYMQLKLPGHGFPRSNGNGYGDQILLIKPYIPDNIDNNIITTIREHQQNKQ